MILHFDKKTSNIPMTMLDLIYSGDIPFPVNRGGRSIFRQSRRYVDCGQSIGPVPTARTRHTCILAPSTTIAGISSTLTHTHLVFGMKTSILVSCLHGVAVLETTQTTSATLPTYMPLGTSQPARLCYFFAIP